MTMTSTAVPAAAAPWSVFGEYGNAREELEF